MTILARVADVADLPRIALTLAEWQRDRGPVQLHPGDLGWHSLAGPARTAAGLTLWSRAGEVLAVGMRDGPDLLRLAMDPRVREDDEVAGAIASDLGDPDVGALPAGEVSLEAWGAAALRNELERAGWTDGDMWTPLRRDLSEPVERHPGLRVVELNADDADRWLAVHWSAFRGSTFTEAEAVRRRAQWSAMTTGPFSRLVRPLLGVDADGEAVAVIAVWSAGERRPGLIEPLGVHRAHRGRGYGAAITRAGAGALRESDASSAVVIAESANVGALATYAAAGFTAGLPGADLVRRDAG